MIDEVEVVTQTDTCGVCGVIGKDKSESPSRLWAIRYELSGVGKGCALCKATNPASAENILRHDGLYNSESYIYKILSIEEVIIPPCDGLMAEEVITLKEVAEGPYH